ncbi:putative 28S rRNA (cytosine-C(5))-methyltransferase [Turnera subulata]|uniref:28S rRNA (Cytosine-C(5))-methyltransferase n=1 Tax=Turnera subulata TaxID=218843 RepID=A0A9Q0G8T2_9ROSI|nr:putative 28S rRNA (cytosine-C(5))-methyltransferase [Turnera subulata]
MFYQIFFSKIDFVIIPDVDVDIEVLHGDFLNIDPTSPPFSKVSAILLDPSCSGSGTSAQRLDHLLPSRTSVVGETERLNKLAAFQKKALSHALSFPAVQRIVYSTCSVNQAENEDVITSVLPLAESHGFQLVKPFPHWQRRGLPIFEGSQCLLRTDPVEDKEGFFIALFVKKGATNSETGIDGIIPKDHVELHRSHPVTRTRCSIPVQFGRISKVWFHHNLLVRRMSSHV